MFVKIQTQSVEISENDLLNAVIALITEKRITGQVEDDAHTNYVLNFLEDTKYFV